VSRYDAGWSPEEIAADRACRQAGREMGRRDGLLDPGLDDVFGRLSRRSTRQIGDNNANGFKRE
jgi:hypothetical protein